MNWASKIVATSVLLPLAYLLLTWSWSAFYEGYHNPSWYLAGVLISYALGAALLIRLRVTVWGERRPRRRGSAIHRAVLYALVGLTVISVAAWDWSPWLRLPSWSRTQGA